MRVVVLGSTGRIGSLILGELLAAGHTASVLVRRADGAHRDGVDVTEGSVADSRAVHDVITGSDAVIAALGPRSNTVADEEALERGMRTVSQAMGESGVRRLIALSGAAVNVPGDSKPIIDRIATSIVRVAAKHVVGAKQREYEVFAATDLDWTALRPPLVRDGPPVGYRLSDRLKPGARVTRADVARAMVDQVSATDFVRRAPFVLPR